MIVPLFLSITWGGTFASGETVSVEVNFTIVYGANSQNTLGMGNLLGIKGLSLNQLC